MRLFYLGFLLLGGAFMDDGWSSYIAAFAGVSVLSLAFIIWVYHRFTKEIDVEIVPMNIGSLK